MESLFTSLSAEELYEHLQSMDEAEKSVRVVRNSLLLPPLSNVYKLLHTSREAVWDGVRTEMPSLPVAKTISKAWNSPGKRLGLALIACLALRWYERLPLHACVLAGLSLVAVIVIAGSGSKRYACYLRMLARRGHHPGVAAGLMLAVLSASLAVVALHGVIVGLG